MIKSEKASLNLEKWFGKNIKIDFDCDSCDVKAVNQSINKHQSWLYYGTKRKSNKNNDIHNLSRKVFN